MDRKYPPGSILNEADLANTFGCSTTPVREAIRRLQAEGLIEVIPYKGYLVTQASLREMQDLLELRAGLEGLAAELAATRATETDLDRLSSLAEHTFVRGNETSYRSYELVNREFHLTVAKATRNQQLYNLVETIFDQVHRLLLYDLHQANPTEAVQEHRDLIKALRMRRPALARKAMMVQILRTRERLLTGM